MEELDKNVLFSDLFSQNLAFIEGKIDTSNEEEEEEELAEEQSENASNNIPLNDHKETDENEEEEDIQVSDDEIEEEPTVNIRNVSYELNKKQSKCFNHVTEMKTNNLRFTATQICTYFYNDLYKFFFHAFTLLSIFPIHLFLNDITILIQQVGHYTHKEYFEHMKLAFQNLFSQNLHLVYSTVYFFNSQFNSYCLKKTEIIEIYNTIYERFDSQVVFQQILFYRPYQSSFFEKKIGRIEKELKRLRNKVKNLTSIESKSHYDKNPLSLINDEIIKDVVQNSTRKPQSRKYTEKFTSFCSIAYLFGTKCYNFLAKRIPLCSVSYLKKLSNPIINEIMKSLFQIDQIFKIIESYKLNGLHASLAVDAASFQKITGEGLLKKSVVLQSIENLQIEKDEVYSNVFVFLLQPFSQSQRTIPIQIFLNQNGNANIHIIEIIKSIVAYLNMYNIIIDFICTDGDHFYDLEHRMFFDDYINRVYEFENFEFIYSIYVINRVLLPNSDILHILKGVRRNLLNKDFIYVDYYNSITISIDEFEQYDLNKIINDTSSNGGMKDSYPLLLFSFQVFKTMCERGNYAHAFFVLPYFFLAESIRNPILSNDSRIYYLEVSFWIILYFFHQHNLVKKHYVHSKIGLIRTLNTILTIIISIQKHVLLKLSRVGTHCLECFFGLVRLACHGNHNLANILRSIAKSIFIKNELIKINEEVTIKGRDNLGGTQTDQNSTLGVLPQCKPNEFFCLMLRLVKGCGLKEDLIVLNSFIEMKSNENDAYSKNFMKIYLQGPFAGSNIKARYINNRTTKNENTQKSKDISVEEEDEDEEDTNEHQEEEEALRPQPRNAEEDDILNISYMMGEKPDVIQFFSAINSSSIVTEPLSEKKRKNQRNEHFFNFIPKE